MLGPGVSRISKPMDYKDYYATLGVSKDATEKDIKQAYRRLARKHHPDVNPGSKEAEEKFKDVSEAYEVLGDKEKRAKYDSFGQQWQGGGGQPGPGYGAPGGFRYENFDGFDTSGGGFGDFDFFEMLFGPRGAAEQQGRRQARGHDVEAQIEVTIEESYKGAAKSFTIGTGGRGQSKRLEVKIPPGVRDGSRIRLLGEGEAAGHGGKKGDLYLIVHMAPNSTFERKGDDLYTDASVPFTTAILGGEIQVGTVNGKVTMRIPAGTQSGQTFRLGGKGMPRLGKTGSGDLYARMRISVPKDLTPRQKELVQELATTL